MHSNQFGGKAEGEDERESSMEPEVGLSLSNLRS